MAEDEVHHTNLLARTETTSPNGGNFEVPTAPASPALEPSAAQPVLQAPPHSLSPSSITRKGPIQSGQSRCAICTRRIPKYSKRGQIDHINACWGQLRELAANAKTAKVAEGTGLEVAHRVLARTGNNPRHELRLPVTELEAAFAGADTAMGDFSPVVGNQAFATGVPHRSAPDVNEAIMSNTIHCIPPPAADDAAPDLPTAAALPPPPETAPTECLICSKTLSLSAIDALIHQRHCLNQEYPPNCPVCGVNFPSFPTNPFLPPSPLSPAVISAPNNKWTPDTVLEHLDFCMRREPPIKSQHHEDFTAILKSCDRPWGMAKRLLERRFGPRQFWLGRDHRQSRARKMRRKTSEDGKPYSIKPTPFRKVESHYGARRFVTTTRDKTLVCKELGLDIVRKMAFNKLPDKLEIPPGKSASDYRYLRLQILDFRVTREERRGDWGYNEWWGKWHEWEDEEEGEGLIEWEEWEKK